MKFRIIETKQTDGSGKHLDSFFHIEKKVLWWWVMASIPYGYTLPLRNESQSDLMIRWTCIKFRDIKQAEKVLQSKLLEGVQENYKGNKIVLVLSDNADILFVNKSNRTDWYADHPCYEYSRSLSHLKAQIDSRIKVYKQSVVAEIES